MREQLIQYVRLLFVGTVDTEDVQQEILQNTLDKFDDLIDQGKSPEAAYRLAISGIGDINEILGTPPTPPAESCSPPQKERKAVKRLMQSVAVALYILCLIPLFLLQNELGLCLLLLVVAVATALLVIFNDGKDKNEERAHTARKRSHRWVAPAVWLLGTFGYFALSFATNAWWITWLVFPMLAAIHGLINAIIDLKEVCRNES